MYEGGCHCGAVRYLARGAPNHSSVCHCSDCRRCAGATGVAWAGFPIDGVEVQGELATYCSSPGVERKFCLICGTGLFYVTADAPEQVDIQTATLDEPDALPPTRRVQLAEAVSWEADMHKLPGFERFPSA